MQLTTALQQIFTAALQEVEPTRLVRAALTGFRPHGRVVVVGGGKAAASMALGVEAQLEVARGLVVVKAGHALRLRTVDIAEGGHPLPNAAGVAACRRMAALLGQCSENDHVIACISGGGSALLTLPVGGTVDSLRERTDALLRSGADIHQINARRRQWSALADGGITRLAAPAPVTGLILSDVLGNEIADIASGPTLGAENLVIGSLDLAIDAAAAEARRLGFPVRIGSRALTGEAREVGRWLAEQSGCVICGGETTVTVRGTGLGGRNQELALSAAIALRGRSDVVILSAGTDGTDGPTEAAGAIVDGRTADVHAEQALVDNDSHSYLKRRGALLVTGPTLTNVGDLQIRLCSG